MAIYNSFLFNYTCDKRKHIIKDIFSNVHTSNRSVITFVINSETVRTEDVLFSRYGPEIHFSSSFINFILELKLKTSPDLLLPRKAIILLFLTSIV